MLSAYVLIDSVIIFSLLILAVMSSLNGGYKKYENRLFIAISIMVAIWIPANHIGNNVDISVDIALLANRIIFPCAFGALILMMYFAVQLADRNYAHKISKWASPVLWTVCLLSVTPLVVDDIERQDNLYAVIFGPFVSIYGILLVLMVGFIFYALLHGMRHRKGVELNQLQVITLSLAVALPAVVTLSFILPATTGIFAFTEFGVAPLILFVIGMYYSVVKHRLFDIKLVVVRTAAYFGALATLSLMYYGLVYVMSMILLSRGGGDVGDVEPISVLTALILAFMFQPVKTFFDRMTNNFFYRGSYDTDTLYAEMSKLLASTTDLRVLLERAAVKISDTIKAEQGMFFVYHSGDLNHYVSAGTKKRSYLALADAHALNRHVESNGDDVIVAELLDKDHHLRRMMTGYKLSIILPLRRAGVIVGYLCLGNHKGSGFTSKDVRVLETLRDELVVAVQNALAVQEIKEMNATLEQKIDIATKELRTSNAKLRHIDEVKDEFMSMASHQLRTPLTSVKGYLSMVLEGDAGKVNPQQKQLLEEAFNSSERMVRLISDFLNVSRLQTGKFLIEKAPIDLAAVASQEVASLRVLAAGHGMKIDFVQPGEPCMINADEGKVRQVIMNFIDNAIYYSKPDSTITVSLVRDRNEYDLVVADTGIGVPKAEQDRLFHKFFRATNARSQRPDGTGVGLFLARKVITAHGGKLIFTSTEGKGSRFGFSLPVFNKK